MKNKQTMLLIFDMQPYIYAILTNSTALNTVQTLPGNLNNTKTKNILAQFNKATQTNLNGL